MIFASRSLLRWPVLLLVTGNSQCPPSSLVWVWKTWIITPELKLILVKTSLDLAGNIKYSQSTQGIIFHNNRLRVRGIFVFQCLCNVQYAWQADKDWWRLLSLLSVIPDFDPSIWPGRHQHRTHYIPCTGQMHGSLTILGLLNTRLCSDAESVDTTMHCQMKPVSCHAGSVRKRARATNWVVNIGPYYILQPPPLYCHRYWTHARTDMRPLWPFSRGFMLVLYAIQSM